MKRHQKNPKRLPRQKRWPNAYFAKVGLWSLRENRMHGSEAGESGSTGLPCPYPGAAILAGDSRIQPREQRVGWNDVAGQRPDL